MKIVIIGHSIGVKRCIDSVLTTTHQVVALFTHPRKDHQRDLELYARRSDLFGEYGYDVFHLPNDYGIPVFEYHDLTDQSEIDRIAAFNPDVIVTVGCRDILKPVFIEQFKFVINVHPYYLPYFRGAGIDSWMILQGYSGTTQQATCHFISPRIDAGDVIDTAPYVIPQDALPIDIFKIRIDTLGSLLVRSLDKLTSSDGNYQSQQEEVSHYYPRLNTMRDGRIDFTNWNGAEIELFIRAFSFPYEGAWAMYGEQRFHFHHATFIPTDGVHPFSYGLIFRKDENAIYVFVKGGVLTIRTIECDQTALSPRKIKLGKYLNQ
ncbi:MAG: hypothetical protein RL226_688 [Bacteroidota bacterium]